MKRQLVNVAVKNIVIVALMRRKNVKEKLIFIVSLRRSVRILVQQNALEYLGVVVRQHNQQPCQQLLQYQQHQPLQFHLLTAIQYVEVQMKELLEIAVENNIVIVHPKSRQHVKENMSFTVTSIMDVLMLVLMNAWECLGVVTPLNQLLLAQHQYQLLKLLW